MKQILEYLDTCAAAFPEKIAVADGIRNCTFLELKVLSEDLGKELKEKLGSGAPEPVGVLADRNVETLLMFFAVLASGNYYVPLNRKLPKEKLDQIIENSGMRLILGKKTEALEIEWIETEAMKTPKIGENSEQVLPLEDIFAGEQPLYMIYTSGSTGEPKGVVKSHKAMIDFVEAYVKEFQFTSEEILGNQTPFFFDASAKDIYLMLKTGMTMEIIPQEYFSFPPKLIQFLNEKKVTFISWVPSALCFVTQLGTFREVMPETLKRVFFVGETFPMKQFHKWQEALPDLQYVNLYGASELAGICCYYEAGTPETRETLPVGKALGNAKVFLATSEGEFSLITEPGKVGEIYIQSDALAMGYFKDPEKTARSFFLLDGVRTFRTGDMAWYDEDGNLNFAARSDSQIKHMGYRIELGEIEKAVNEIAGVTKSCCLYNKDKRRIVLFAEVPGTAEADSKALGKEIRNQLENTLADYMVPQKVLVKDQLPLNANGKTDRQKLKEEI